MIEVKIGQIWEDVDPRMNGRQFEINELIEPFAYCKNLANGKISRIQLKRFKSNTTGYKLVKDVSP